jgi:hypothetical protein
MKHWPKIINIAFNVRLVSKQPLLFNAGCFFIIFKAIFLKIGYRETFFNH